MAKKIRVWDGTAWQDVAPSLPYTAIHSAQASMPLTGVDGQVWLDTDGTLAGQDFVPLTGGTMTGNLNVPSINSGPIVGRNKILNGDFNINQRNSTSTTSAWTFLADRWKSVSFSGSATWSISTIDYASFSGQMSNKALRITSSSSSNDHGFQQAIEDVSTFAGQSVTVSFWARSNSASYSLDLVELMQNFGSGGSSNVYTYFDCSGKTITSTWQKIEMTLTLPSVASKTIGSGNYLNLRIDPTVTLPSGAWIEITHIQLEAGNQATPFHTATPNQQTELAACQRYYWRQSADSTSVYGLFGYGPGLGTTTVGSAFVNPVPMRTAASSVDFSTLQVNDGVTITAVSSVNLVAARSNSRITSTDCVTAGGLTATRFYMIGANNNASAYIGFSAEL